MSTLRKAQRILLEEREKKAAAEKDAVLAQQAEEKVATQKKVDAAVKEMMKQYD